MLLLVVRMVAADRICAAGEPAIPAGQEKLLAAMLGQGTSLPGGCRFSAGNVEHSAVRAVYACADGEFAFELTHPSKAGPATVLTAKFAVTPQTKSSPDTLTAALVALIRAREHDFEWTSSGQSKPAEATRRAAAPDREALAANWDAYSPNPYLNVALEGLGGWLYRTYMVVALALLLIPPLLAPWCGRRAAEENSSRHPALIASATGIGLVAIAAVAIWFSYGTTIDFRVLTEEHELPILFADHCAHGLGCPLAGQQVSSGGVRLGPLYFVILTACRYFSHDLDVPFGLILGAHAIAAAVAVLLGNRLYGTPWGYLAGLIVALCPSLARMFLYLTHVNFVPLPMIGFIGGLLYLARDGGNRPFFVAAASLAAATQLHAITAVFLPSLLFTALRSRPRPSRRGWLAGGAAWLVLYAPWIVYNFESGFRDFAKATLAGWPGESQPFLEAWIVPPWMLIGVPLLALGFDALSRRSPAADRAVARALLLAFVLPPAAFLCLPTWRWQYTAPFLLILPFAWIHALRAPLTWIRSTASRRLSPVALANLVCAAVTLILLQDGLGHRAPMPSGLPVWREERSMVQTLERRALRVDDIATRVEGFAWPGLTPNPGVFVQQEFAPPPQSLTPRDRVLLIEDCLAMSHSFAAWQEVVASLGRPHLLGGYQSDLTAVSAKLVGGQAILWSGTPSLPIFAPSSRETIRQALGETTLAHDSLGAQLLRSWLNLPQVELQIHTSLLPGNEDRVVVIAHDPITTVAAEVDGAPAAPFEAILNGNQVLHERFLIEASRRHHAVPIQLIAQRTAPTFPFITLYEEPHPRCLRQGFG